MHCRGSVSLHCCRLWLHGSSVVRHMRACPHAWRRARRMHMPPSSWPSRVLSWLQLFFQQADREARHTPPERQPPSGCSPRTGPKQGWRRVDPPLPVQAVPCCGAMQRLRALRRGRWCHARQWGPGTAPRHLGPARPHYRGPRYWSGGAAPKLPPNGCAGSAAGGPTGCLVACRAQLRASTQGMASNWHSTPPDFNAAESGPVKTGTRSPPMPFPSRLSSSTHSLWPCHSPCKPGDAPAPPPHYAPTRCARRGGCRACLAPCRHGWCRAAARGGGRVPPGPPPTVGHRPARADLTPPLGFPPPRPAGPRHMQLALS